MKGNKFAFALLLGAAVLVMLLYSCSLPLPIVHGKKRVASDEEEEEEEEDV
jgi:hypothetical protein